MPRRVLLVLRPPRSTVVFEAGRIYTLTQAIIGQQLTTAREEAGLPFSGRVMMDGKPYMPSKHTQSGTRALTGAV